jgi:hypothetical protein
MEDNVDMKRAIFCLALVLATFQLSRVFVWAQDKPTTPFGGFPSEQAKPAAPISGNLWSCPL